jgi:LysM repeat protein
MLSLVSLSVLAQPSDKMMSRQQYIEKYHDAAIKEMLSSGIPASITMAQALLESDNGNSPLAKYARNHFGIKCHGWEGGKFIQDDDAKNECFRKYRQVEQSYHDHSQFLSTRNRYAFLFDLKRTDYKAWAKGLRKAGYATNPRYADLLIKIIEDNALYSFDKMNTVEKKLAKNKAAPVVKAPKPNLKPKAHKSNVSSNHIKFVSAKKGESLRDIAESHSMGLWQLLKYNDLKKGMNISEGDIIYLQPKRKKTKTNKHVVKENETMRDISQKYGIKINTIYKRNYLPIGSSLEEGQVLYLNSKAPI